MRMSLGFGVDSRGDVSFVAFECLQEGGAEISSLGDKPSKGRDASSKVLAILNRLRVHEDLVRPRIGIHEAKKGVASGGVDKLVNSREREAILGTSPIQVGVVYTHALAFSWFVDHHHIGQPGGVVHLLDETNVAQLVHLRLLGLVSLWVIGTTLLPSGSNGRVDAEPVGNDIGRYARHVSVGPGKDLGLYTKEGCEGRVKVGQEGSDDLDLPI
ncbi:unnamed protein product [Prunus armeniaca]